MTFPTGNLNGVRVEAPRPGATARVLPLSRWKTLPSDRKLERSSGFYALLPQMGKNVIAGKHQLLRYEWTLVEILSDDTFVALAEREQGHPLTSDQRRQLYAWIAGETQRF